MPVNATEAKIASMLAIGIGSFVVGVAPACFVSRVRDLQQKLLLSCVLCFGGGVLFATAVLHMLPETREGLPDHAELVFAAGFLLLYLIDEVVHCLWGKDVEHAPEHHHHGSRSIRDRSERYGSRSHQVNNSPVTRPARCVCTPDTNVDWHYQTNPSGNAGYSGWKGTTYGAVQYAPNAPAPCCNEEATFLCHGNHTEPCADSNASVTGLLLALTVHSVLEGLAVGLQKAASEVVLLVGAVASHKFVVGFCLGLELAEAGSSILKLILAMFVFSSGSAIGIGIGMLTLRAENPLAGSSLPILQGLAGGTLLYVTVSEVLPRERARWHRSARRSAGILQFFSVALGFLLIFVLNSYIAA